MVQHRELRVGRLIPPGSARCLPFSLTSDMTSDAIIFSASWDPQIGDLVSFLCHPKMFYNIYVPFFHNILYSMMIFAIFDFCFLQFSRQHFSRGNSLTPSIDLSTDFGSTVEMAPFIFSSDHDVRVHTFYTLMFRNTYITIAN